MNLLEEEKIRLEAEQARQIINNPLFVRHNNRHRAELITQIINEEDEARRTAVWHEIRAHDNYINALQQYIYSSQQLGEEK